MIFGCQHALHTENSSWVGWHDNTLGTVIDGTGAGHICPGCAAYEASLVEPEEPEPDPQ